MASHGKEIGQLHDIAHDLLLNAEEELVRVSKATGKTPSELKRVRKALNNVDWNHQSYGDLIETSLTKYGYDHKPLQKAIRNMEERTMDAFALLSDDTIHHLVQQRTGGSLNKASPSVIRGAVKRLEDMFGMQFSQSTGEFGNVRGDTSLSNYAHKSDNNQSGLERESGIGKNPNKHTTAHAKGTAGFARQLTAAEQLDEDAIVEAMTPRIAEQIDLVDVAKTTDSPRIQRIREIPGLERAYMPDNTASEIADMKVIAGNPTNKPLILDSYQSLVADKGSIHYRPQLTAGKFYAQGLGAAAGFASSEEAMTKALDGDYAGALGSAIPEMLLGEGLSFGIQQVAPQVAKIAPRVVGGAMKLAPFLAPVSAVTTGITVGNVLADNAAKRREENPNLTRNTQYSYNDAFMHSEDNPVTIQAN